MPKCRASAMVILIDCLATNMRIPAFLRQRLEDDAALQCVVLGAVTAASPLISSRPVFFPEYTDHGPQHFEMVLNTCEALIPHESRKRFTSSDAALLIGGVLLHDLGMHLTEDGFDRLVYSGETPLHP